MTEAKDRPEQAERNADEVYAPLMREWGELLLQTHRAWQERLEAARERGEIPLDQWMLPRSAGIAYGLVEWLGAELSGGVNASGRATLERLATVFEAVEGDRIRAAAAIVQEGAEQFRTGAWPPEYVARGLIWRLESHVHGFRVLLNQLEAVIALLNRYEPDKSQRGRPAKGIPSKVSSAGVLVRLNEMCSPTVLKRPLRSLSTSGVDNAVKHTPRIASSEE